MKSKFPRPSLLKQLFNLRLIFNKRTRLVLCLLLLGQGLLLVVSTGSSAKKLREGRADKQRVGFAQISDTVSAAPPPTQSEMTPALKAIPLDDTSDPTAPPITVSSFKVLNCKKSGEAAALNQQPSASEERETKSIPPPGRRDEEPPPPVNEDGDDIPPTEPPASGDDLTAPAPTEMLEPRLPSPQASQSFAGGFDEPEIGTNFGFIPPDTTGAVGLDKLFVTLNNNYVAQSKTTGARLSACSINGFWSPLNTTGAADPRVQYDPYNNRWLAVAISNLRAPDSTVLVAVSQTSDPEGDWLGVAFKVGCEGGTLGCHDAGQWADFPMLGFNKNWVGVTWNYFAIDNAGYVENGGLLIDYPKLRNGTVEAIRIESLGGSQAGFCMHPATTYSATEEVLYLVSHFDRTVGSYVVFDVSPAAPSEPLPIGVKIKNRRGGGWKEPSGNVLPQHCPTEPCPAPGQIHAVDDTIRSNVVFRNGRLYYAQTVGLGGSSANVFRRTAAQWTVLDAQTGVFLDGGRIEDASATDSNGGKWYAHPSISVNRDGDIMLGFSEFESDDFVDAGYAFRFSTDPPETMRDPVLYKEGEDYYSKVDGGGRNRWGDYSHTVVDPTNDRDLWTIQEYAAQRVGTGANSSRWGTWWAKVTTPLPPAAPTNLSATPDAQPRIKLNWTDNSDDEDGYRVERADEHCAEFREIECSAPTPTGCEDTNVLPGTTYTYRVSAFREASGASSPSNEVSVKTLDSPLVSATRLASRRAFEKDSSGNSAANSPAISDDGRFVAFVSTSTNLHEKDKQSRADVYVRDMQSGVIELISIGSSGEQSDGISTAPSISGDGRFVVFESTATNIVSQEETHQDTNGKVKDIFIRDRVSCRTSLVSISASASAAAGASTSPLISRNGESVVFVSKSHLVAPDGDQKPDVYVYRRNASPAVSLVSINNDCSASGNGISTDPVISADGRLVAFASNSTTLVPSARDGLPNFDIFLRDITQVCQNNDNHIELISTNRDGNRSSNGDSTAPSMSESGLRIAFVSTGSNLVNALLREDTKPDIYVRDRAGAGSTELVSINRDGDGSGNAPSVEAVISGNGEFVAFVSRASNLIPLADDGKERDRNDKRDVFLRALGQPTQPTILVSATQSGRSAKGASGSPVMSFDGRFVAFLSTGTNLISNVLDNNGAPDVFLRFHSGDTDTTELISISAPTGIAANPPRTANGASTDPLISREGDFVAFVSTGSNVTYNDLNHKPDVFRRTSQQKLGAAAFTQPTIQFAEPSFIVNEEAGLATVTVTRDGVFSSSNMSVNYSTGGGTATPGSDYTHASGTLVFSGTEASKTFDVPIHSDTLDERDETVSLTLSNPTGGATLGSQSSASLTIEDDDAPPKATIADVTVAEPLTGTTSAVFTVTLSAASAQLITLDYETEDGTAQAGSDYEQTASALTFNPGETVKTVPVTINSDALAEGSETFSLNLSDSPAVIAPTGHSFCNIKDNGVLITEFRFRGPTPSTPDAGDGSLDEFIELYNNSDAPLTVSTLDGSAGWALVAVDSENLLTTLGVIPNGTVIPARGHYLFVNKDAVNNTGGRYSLDAYAAGDSFYTHDIADDAGIALFVTANADNFVAERRLDAVGFDRLSGDIPGLFREGAGLPPVVISDGQYSFVRKLAGGAPQDTNDNEQDFVFVSPDGGRYGRLSSILGAPGPENMSSPAGRSIAFGPLDPLAFETQPPNRLRNTSAVGENARFGTLAIRRTYTNNTGSAITRLRFRVIDITTLNSPNICNGCVQADVRVLSRAGSFNVTRTDGTSAVVHGTSVEEVAAQSTDLGGGLNHSLSTGTITLETPLGQGASINVEFLLGVESTGFFRFYVNFEALP
ncbi:MAG TPA: Calx-beta domain-containing protein [Pyrinomonadaceae bacterium]|nr:Calx-beta domain-containing protein [Pyrinomonadaceae bacterium]